MIRAQVLKHVLGASEGQKRGSKGNVKREETAKGAMEKIENVGVIEKKEVRRDCSGFEPGFYVNSVF